MTNIIIHWRHRHLPASGVAYQPGCGMAQRDLSQHRCHPARLRPGLLRCGRLPGVL